MIPRVTSAEVVGSHALHLRFHDGVEKTVDLGYLLHGPVFAPLRDPAYFALVCVDQESGTIAWPNGADVAPERLYTLPDLTRPAA